MGGPKRPSGDALRARIQAWGDEWRAIATATDPADRATAEAAITALYRSESRPEPRFAWVPSPAAGILAHGLVLLAYRPIRGDWGRGDPSTGANREINALALPFGLEPAWVRRTAIAVRERLPEDRRALAGSALDPLPGMARALGMAASRDFIELIGEEAQERASEPEIEPPTPPGPGPAVDAVLVESAAAILGEAWPRLTSTLGPEVGRELFVAATRRVAEETLASASTWSGQALLAMQPGQWELAAPMLAAARDLLGGSIWRPRTGRAERELLVEARLAIARSAGPWWAHEGLAIVVERPLVVRIDDLGRPHAADGPAIAWGDGTTAFAWHGLAVGEEVILRPGAITVEGIDGERNTERRRVLIERFGAERLVREGGAELRHEDETGRLWVREVGPRWWRDEPVAMVEVVNSTPEPDGSRRTYFLRVPPSMRRAREAVAWTFGMAGHEYRPAQES